MAEEKKVESTSKSFKNRQEEAKKHREKAMTNSKVKLLNDRKK